MAWWLHLLSTGSCFRLWMTIFVLLNLVLVTCAFFNNDLGFPPSLLDFFFFVSYVWIKMLCISNLLYVACHMSLILIYLNILTVLSKEVCCYSLFCPASSFLLGFKPSPQWRFWTPPTCFSPLLWELKFSHPYQISHKAIVLCIWIGFLITLIADRKSSSCTEWYLALLLKCNGHYSKSQLWNRMSCCARLGLTGACKYRMIRNDVWWQFIGTNIIATLNFTSLYLSTFTNPRITSLPFHGSRNRIVIRG